MTTVGAVFLPQLPPERLRAVAAAADEAGLDELWLWEDCFLESGVATAAAALAWTERLQVGVGLLPVPLRNVALTAMEAGHPAPAVPGPAVTRRRARRAGLDGAGRRAGRVAADPAARVRCRAARAAGRREVSTTGRYVRLDRVALDWPPPTAPAVLAGADGPAHAAAVPARPPTARSSPAAPRRRGERGPAGSSTRAGRRPAGPDRTRWSSTCTPPPGRTRAARLSAERVRWGTAVDARTGPQPATRDAVAEAVPRWAEAGADTVVLQPTADEPDPEGFVAFAAEVGRAVARPG